MSEPAHTVRKGGDAMIYHPSEYQTTATRFIESHEQAILLLEMGL